MGTLRNFRLCAGPLILSTIKNQLQIKSLQNTQLIYKITQMSTRVKGTWISGRKVVIVVRYVSGAAALSGVIRVISG